MSNALLHLLGIALGLAASIACATCFYLAGSHLIPRRWDERLGRDESPALIGAAIYVVVCWFGVELGIAVKHVAVGFTVAVAAFTVVRYRWIAAVLKSRSVVSRSSLRWWGAFGFLYLIAYLHTLPPVGREYLPLAWTGNIDLLAYISHTRYLWELGPSNLVGFAYLNYVYLQTPGVFYLLGWFSMLFGSDPLSAAMPAQFALIAFIGVMAARISYSVFGVRWLAAVAIGCVMIGGPFFRYVVGAYFLSTLMSTPIFLYLLWTTISHRPGRLVDVPLMVRFGSAYVLLLFIYPFLLFAAVGAQVGAMVLLLIAEMQAADSRSWREVVRDAGRVAFAAAVTFAFVAACFLERLKWSFDVVTGLSQVGVAGWPLQLISPLALLGFPGVRRGVQVEAPELRMWAIAAFFALALTLMYLYFWRLRRTTTPAQKAFVALVSGGIVVYCAYYLRIGPSYQQWKFATYTVLPFTFVICAAVVHLVSETRPSQLAFRSLAAIAGFLIAGNLFVHARDDRPLIRLRGALRNLEHVNELPFFKEMSLDVRGARHLYETYLALYFLPSKRVHVISDDFEPSEELSFETISKVRPLLMQNYGCQGVGHDDTMTIPDLGCLVLAPPSPVPDAVYPFNRSFLFIEWDYMTAREAGGRWNTRPRLKLRITADPQRARVAQDAYVNLFLHPFLPPGVKPPRLVFSLGNEPRGEISVSDQEWISLPVRTMDWSGDRAWSLSISIAFPDGRTILFHELSVSERPRGRVVAIS